MRTKAADGAVGYIQLLDVQHRIARRRREHEKMYIPYTLFFGGIL